MAESLNRKKENRFGRLFICLLLAAVFVSQFALTAAADDAIQGLNSSGSRNREPSVDPFENSEGFSTTLYDIRNGLPTSDANDIAQTGDGFIWIGSYAGLVRYDGNSFERIDSTTGIANVRCLYVDSKDRLWIGTNDSGVFMMSKGVLLRWDRADGLRSSSIRAIAEDGKGRMYIAGAAAGIATINSSMELTVLEDGRLEGKTVPELRLGGDGLIYGFTQEGDLFTMDNGELKDFIGYNECRVKEIHCIMPDPAHPGRLYLGNEASEIFCGYPANNFSSLSVTDVSPLYAVNCLEYINGQIWICASNGIGRLDNDGFRMLENVPVSNSVEHLMTDFSGHMWFASSHQGVMKIVPNQFTDIFKQYDLPETVVNSTCMNGSQLFIGTDTGLIVIDGNKKLDSLPLKRAMTASGKSLQATDLLEMLDGIRIRCIVRDSQGRLWIPAWRRYGVLRYDHGEVVAFGQDEGLFSNAVRIVCECEDGSVLVANNGGLSVVKGGRVKKNYGSEDGIVNGDILTLVEGFNHEYILGSDGDGIYVITAEGTRHIGTEDGLMSDIILRIKKSSSHDVYWILTGNSLAYMTPDFKVTTVRNFPYPNNFDLYENSKGDLWVLCSAGIYVVSAEDILKNENMDPVFFGIQSGLPYVATSNAISELTPSGDLYIAGSAGVVKVNIEQPYGQTIRYSIAVPYVEADGERYYADLSGQFNLPANARKVTIYPYVFNYSLTDPLVSYRLAGFDSGDTSVSRSRLQAVDYTNLKIGTYHFVITVKDSISHTEQSAMFAIAKGKEMSAGTVGSIIMGCASLLLMAGIIVYTSRHRKRDGIEDRLFFAMVLTNIAMTVGELMSYTLEFLNIIFVRQLMYAGNTVFYIALSVFPYLLILYLDYRCRRDRDRLKKAKLIFGIPLFLLIILMAINLKTGWIFSIGEGNVFIPGPHRLLFLPVIPVWFYLLLSLLELCRIDLRLLALTAALIIIRLLGEIICQDISSTSFIYTLILVGMHLFSINRLHTEEARLS